MEGATSINRDSSDTEINEYEETPPSSCCDPRGCFQRFLALILMCVLGFGSYYCYDNPGALQDNFKKDLNLTTTDFVMLYSIYSWPNVILCFVGGFLLDSVFGIRLGTNIFMIIVLIGQCIFASGALFDTFWLMIVGRFIFGVGAESLAVAQNSYAVLWFRGNILNFVFGVQLSFARVGSTVNFLTMEPLYNYVNNYFQGYECTGVVLFIAATTCIISLVSALLLGWMDKRAERILRRNENSNGEVIRFRDIKDFKATFWMVSVICVAYYVAIFPFVALGKVFFINKFKFSPQDANTVNSILYIISAAASPALGIFIDRLGRNILWVFLSVIATISAHAILTFTMLNPYVGMVTMGLAYSVCASSLWPLVSLIIPDHQLGTAYGICQAVQNLGLAIVSIVAGIIFDNGGYVWLEIFFMLCLGVALLATIVLWVMDSSGTGVLNMSPYEREIHECNRRATEILEQEKLLSSSGGPIGPNDLLQASSSDFHIRNRYLSRIGANLPSHYNINSKGLAYRALR